MSDQHPIDIEPCWRIWCLLGWAPCKLRELYADGSTRKYPQPLEGSEMYAVCERCGRPRLYLETIAADLRT